MAYILLSILSSTGIFWMFKLIDKKQLPTVGVITINYLVAYLFGFLLFPKNPIDSINQDWLGMAFAIGFLFIVFFFVVGLSSKYAGMSITSVASKMSVIVPITFSIIYYQELINNLKVIGIGLAMIGLFLAVYSKKENKANELSNGIKSIFYPLILFLGMGVVDSLIKYTQETIGVSQSINGYFTSVLFLISFLLGASYILISAKRRVCLRMRSVYVYGLILGLFNYGSIYFLISALNTSSLDSSVIFGINNVSIVVVSVLIGVWAFKERISKLNYLGIICSVIAIWLLSIS